jgi:hypothetical protein
MEPVLQCGDGDMITQTLQVVDDLKNVAEKADNLYDWLTEQFELLDEMEEWENDEQLRLCGKLGDLLDALDNIRQE